MVMQDASRELQPSMRACRPERVRLRVHGRFSPSFYPPIDAEKNKHKLRRAQLPQPHRASRNYRESRCSLREARKGEITLLATATKIIITDRGGRRRSKKYIRKNDRSAEYSLILRLLLTYGKILFDKTPIIVVIIRNAIVPIMRDFHSIKYAHSNANADNYISTRWHR